MLHGLYRRSLPAALFGFAALVGAALVGAAMSGAALAQPAPVDHAGVTHLVTATVNGTAAPASPNDDRRISGLRITLRISDHARETQFFGEVPVSVPEFAASQGAPEQKAWEDARCHQKRGFPRATVAAIEGAVESAETHAAISARARHIGVMVPADEIRQAQPMPGGHDERGAYLAFRTETAQSHMVVVLKIYTIDCTLK
jgi:hypothetical protein